jgi:hypothetical protein
VVGMRSRTLAAVAALTLAETSLVIGTGPGSSSAGFARLEADLHRAVSADQADFSASAGSGSFGALQAGMIIAALLVAAGSACGLSRRLAEYR